MQRSLGPGGVVSSDCDVNPTFCDFNLVYMKYCDGNSFSGALEGVIPVENENQHHRGHYILGAALEDLLANHGLADATEFHLTGCSAGGLSTFLHTDFVGDFVRGNAPNLEKYGSSPISGFFLDRENVVKEHIYGDEIKNIFGLSNATSGVHGGCVEASAPGEEWRCNMAANAYEHVENPIFPFDASIDSWQSGCIMTSTAVDTSVPADQVPNGNCGSVEGWGDCSGDLSKCDEDQIYAITEYQGSFMRHMSNSKAFNKNGNGAFIYECHTHCAAQDSNYYTQVKLTGPDGVSKTMQQATDDWWKSVLLDNGQNDVPAQKFTPQLYSLKDGSNPNESCNVGETGGAAPCYNGVDCFHAKRA